MRALRKRGRALGVVAALAGLIVYAAVAIADNTVADGDGVAPIGNNDLAFNDVACGVTSQKSVLIALNRNGSYTPGTQVFKKSTQATVSVLSASGTGVSGSVPASPDNLIDVPSNWDTVANNTMTTDYVEATVSVNSSVEGAGSGSVTFRASGTNPSNSPVSRDDVVNVTWTTGSCAPANTAPTVSFTSPPSTANEGDTKTFNFSVSDSDAGDTFSVAAGYPDCGTGGSYVAASLTTTASGGSFQCTFPDGPANSTVSIQVKDGSDAASNVATTSLTIANVAPTVQFTASANSANEGDTKSYAYTVTDPGVDPNPVVTESCGAQGTLTDTGTNSFDCKFLDNPSSTVSVSADDGDPSNNIGSASIAVTIANVAPTITGISASPANALTGQNVTFTGTATDPSSVDTTAGFNWAFNGGIYGAAGANTFTTSFSTCGTGNTVTAKAKDKDGGESTSATSVSVSVVDATILPPLKPDVQNAIKRGQVVPVKITVGCGSSPATGLAPSVRLVAGDQSASADLDDPVESVTTSVSNADTTGIMRATDTPGMYIYNMQIPASLGVDSVHTVVVRPYGQGTGQRTALVKIRK